jgi:hypothetical protein
MKSSALALSVYSMNQWTSTLNDFIDTRMGLLKLMWSVCDAYVSSSLAQDLVF